MYKAFNIKRMNEPPILINFNRSTREISESQIAEFHNRLANEKSKTGIYITTSKFSAKAKNTAPALSIELLDSDFLLKTIEKIMSKRTRPGR
jgi:restriction endonuclease Mrr